MSPEPEITPSVVAAIPSLLKKSLLEMKSTQKRNSMLFSSNGLSNKFIFTRWGIRPSQRRRYRNLFANIREHCRTYFRKLLQKNEIIYQEKSESSRFGIYLFDHVRGNIILGFVILDDESPFPHSSTSVMNEIQ